MNSTALLSPSDLNSYRIGDFALTQDLDGAFRVLNVRTGTKSIRFDRMSRALRVLKAAAK